ncbi:MAG: hypothetical protein K8R74_08940 [Bacteroidales bacterium]|nr:hypothetical protein [Bacteroidales bacterium]
MRILIGIDDTDNKESRGTGFLSRQLAKQIIANGLGTVSSITRHQLFVHPDIAYTSQNSSACLDITTEFEEELKDLCKYYIEKEAAPGSDAGLCIADWNAVSDDIQDWGSRAKAEVLKLVNAKNLASKNKIYLEGFTGILIGQIGALAAVGLRKSGNDGRFIWLAGPTELRELKPGIFNLEELKLITGIENFITLNGLPLEKNCRVLCHDWIRPIVKDGNPTLILEKVKNFKFECKAATKEYIRTIS